MFNTKFILENGRDVYPGYLDKEQRQALREKYGDRREYMRCGCRLKDGLYYRISEDLKIYPEHNGYVHDRYCSRYKDESGESERQTAYQINEENGEVTAFLSFNPKNFKLKEDIEIEQENPAPDDVTEDENIEEAIVEKEKKKKLVEKREPKLSLPGLIRSINVDAFTEKILTGRNIKSNEEFNKFVFYRMKKVNIARMKKSIGDLSLEQDGVRFIYLPFCGAVKKKEKGLVKCYVKTSGKDGEVYNNFIFENTLSCAIKKFKNDYGTVSDENTMIAGFQYYQKGKNKTLYRVLGRIHLFQVSELGVYCRNLTELDTFNALHKICQEDSNIKLYIPPEDESIGGIIQIKGMEKRILLLFRASKDERITYDASEYEPLVINGGEVITKAFLYDYLTSTEEEFIDYEEY